MTLDPTSALDDTPSIDLDEIMAELDDAYDFLPEEAILAVRQAREHVVPRLLSALRSAFDAVRSGGEPAGQAHFFACFLLAEFRAREALPLLLEAASLPDDQLDILLGDVISEDFARLILSLADDPRAVYDGLIADRNLSDRVRWASATGYRYLVRAGRLSRGEAVEALRAHLRAALDVEDSLIAGPLVAELFHYHAREALAEVREAYSRDFVDEFLIAEEEIDEDLAAAHDAEAVDFCGLAPCGTIDDTLAELRHWGVFREDVDSFDEVSDEWDDENDLDEPSSMLRLGPYYSSRDDLADDPLDDVPPPVERLVAGPRVGRNDPCPCGSGKKFKKCCWGKKQALGDL